MSFHGQILRVKQSALFRITESLFTGPAALPLHQHKLPYVSLLLAGGYNEQTPAADRSCTLGTVIYHPAGEVHVDRFHPNGAHLINLEIVGPSLLDLPSAPDRARIETGGLPYGLGLALFHALNAGAESIDEAATDLSACFLGDRLPAARPAWFARALDYIAVRYDAPLTLAAVSRAASVHPVHLSRSFRRYLQCTMGSYVARLRMRRAFDLLRDTSAPIVDVALACGFADHAHLSRTFRKLTGVTPSAYRLRLRGVRC